MTSPLEAKNLRFEEVILNTNGQAILPGYGRSRGGNGINTPKTISVYIIKKRAEAPLANVLFKKRLAYKMEKERHKAEAKERRIERRRLAAEEKLIRAEKKRLIGKYL